MTKKSTYTTKQDQPQLVHEPFAQYQVDFFTLANQGINKEYIKKMAKITKLTLAELMEILPISMDTFKRKTGFDSNVTEKILEIEEVYQEGMNAFGENFHSWMNTKNVGLGNIKPKVLLRNSFGIRRLLDQVGRIKHGVLA